MYRAFPIVSLVILSGCVRPGAQHRSAPAPTGSPGSLPAPARSFAECRAERLEPDLRPTPVELVKHGDESAQTSYIITTTYLALSPSPEHQATFRNDMQRMLSVLSATPGLVAFRFATSETCLSARTLAVWKDRESMQSFVHSPEHTAAMGHIDEISRGDSTFADWEGEVSTAEWDHVARELARGEGPRR